MIISAISFVKEALSYYLVPLSASQLARITSCEKIALNYHDIPNTLNSVSQYEYQLAHKNCEKQ